MSILVLFFFCVIAHVWRERRDEILAYTRNQIPITFNSNHWNGKKLISEARPTYEAKVILQAGHQTTNIERNHHIDHRPSCFVLFTWK